MKTKTLLENYVDLYTFICTKRQIEEDKLKVLELKAMCLYAKTNRQEAIDLQFEIQASKKFLEKSEEYCNEIGEKYKRLALSFNNSDCIIFCCIFLEGKPSKQVAMELGLSVSYVYKKKCALSKIITEQIEKGQTLGVESQGLDKP